MAAMGILNALHGTRDRWAACLVLGWANSSCHGSADDGGGMNPAEILAEFPDLQAEDIPACMRLAAKLVSAVAG